MCTAICAWLRRKGFRVAPFKAQNMSNNSYPCLGGGEIGRAQVAQAHACGLEPETDMNPILLKPNSATGSQVVVNGRVWKTLPARGYYEHFDELLQVVLDAYDRLSRRFDFVVIEGAGSVAELNLRKFDLVNFGLATRISAPALLVGDIERGGVFASVLGSIALLEPEEKALLRSFAINKFRGDLSLFDEGRAILEQRSGVQCLGVFPWLPGNLVDDEDSLSLPAPGPAQSHSDYAILRFPRISNSTDFRLIPNPAWLDLPLEKQFRVIFLPGTKNTIADLRWMKEHGLDRWVIDQAHRGATIVGICGGYQMMGEWIRDPHGVEGDTREEQGLGLFPMETTMSLEKTVRRVRASTAEGFRVEGYEIHMGESVLSAPLDPLFAMDGFGPEGLRQLGLAGTYLHGALESAEFLRGVLGIEAITAPGIEEKHLLLADWLERHGPAFGEMYT
jgi:adenosylcobyric acid synthase